MKVTKEHRQEVAAKNWYLPAPSNSEDAALENITDLAGEPVMWVPLKSFVAGSYLVLNFGFDERTGIAHYSYEEKCNDTEFTINGFNIKVAGEPKDSDGFSVNITATPKH